MPVAVVDAERRLRDPGRFGRLARPLELVVRDRDGVLARPVRLQRQDASVHRSGVGRVPSARRTGCQDEEESEPHGPRSLTDLRAAVDYFLPPRSGTGGVTIPCMALPRVAILGGGFGGLQA